MVSLDEVMAWDLEEIKDGVRLLLPKDWQFRYRLRDDGLHEATISSPLEEGYKVEWSDAFTDERLVLYGAYGYLLARQHKTHPDSPWVRRPNAVRDAIRQRTFERFGASFGSIPDPEDLDPKEVQAVYEDTLGKSAPTSSGSGHKKT